MKKAPLFIAVILLFLPVSGVQAAPLYVVTSDGNVQKSVLGKSISLGGAVEKVSKDVAMAALDSVKEIAIQEIENKTHIKIESVEATEEQVLGDQLKELVTIEGGVQSENVSIHKEEKGFSILQNGVKATTTLPLSIVPDTHEVFIETNRGKVKLTILPSDALLSIVRANIINIIPEDGTIILEEGEKDIQYAMSGEKSVDIFKLTRIIAPIETTVSATDGTITITNQPKWLNLLGFLLK